MPANFDCVATATGALRAVRELSPSWPSLLFPQHQADPSIVRPHVCASPAVSRTNERPPPTGNGTSAQGNPPWSGRQIVAGGGTPICPLSSRPQQYALPVEVSAQV